MAFQSRFQSKWFLRMSRHLYLKMYALLSRSTVVLSYSGKTLTSTLTGCIPTPVPLGTNPAAFPVTYNTFPWDLSGSMMPPWWSFPWNSFQPVLNRWKKHLKGLSCHGSYAQLPWLSWRSVVKLKVTVCYMIAIHSGVDVIHASQSWPSVTGQRF